MILRLADYGVVRLAPLLAVLILTVAGPAAAQLRPDIPLGHSVYDDLDRLVAVGLVWAPLAGQRPLGGEHVADLVLRARAALDAAGAAPGEDGASAGTPALDAETAAWVRPVLERLEGTLAPELAAAQPDARSVGRPALRARWLDRVHLTATIADSPDRTIPGNGLGEIDALINPLLQHRGGRNLVDGGTVAVETEHWLGVGSWLLVRARPRVQTAWPRGRPGSRTGSQTDVSMQELHARVVLGNLQIDLGRRAFVWGQSPRRALSVSNNARPLDAFQVGSRRPFRLPWIFGRLGAATASVFVSDLGGRQNFPGAKLVGTKLTLQPTRTLEVGVGYLVHSGGKGAPSQSFWDRLADHLLLVDVFRPSDGSEASNKLAGLEVRWRPRSARGVELYWEGLTDDLDDGLRMFTEDAAHTLGLAVPRLSRDGLWSLTAELQSTGVRFYRHRTFQSGITVDERIIGNALGPDGEGAYLSVRRSAGDAHRITLAGSLERRSNDHYTVELPAFAFVRIQDLPEETRIRGTVRWEFLPTAGSLQIEVEAGVESVRNFAFLQGERIIDTALHVGLTRVFPF